MTKKVSLREQKKTETRANLTKVARQLFLAQGYTKTTLEQICARNMISIRTLLRHFDSKEELAIAHLRSALIAFRENIHDENRNLRAMRIWRNVVLDGASNILTDPAFRNYFVFLTEEKELAGPLAAILTEFSHTLSAGLSIDAGVNPEEDLYGQVLAAMLVHGNQAALSYWMSNSGRQDLMDLLLETIDTIQENYSDRKGSRLTKLAF